MPDERGFGRWCAAVLTLAALASPTASAMAGVGSGSVSKVAIEAGGRQRSALLYRPATAAPTAGRPLIVMLHGGHGDAAGALEHMDFRAIADRDGVLLAYPEGVRRSWNDGRHTMANRLGVDDVAFVRTLIARLVADDGVDPSRVYVAGMSNGGFMAARLACAIGERLAGVAVVAASAERTQAYAHCLIARPLPILFMQGTTDRLVPYGGGEVAIGAPGPIVSHDDAIAKWVDIDRCNGAAVRSTIPDRAGDGTSVTIESHDCADGARVVGITIVGGGHAWPGGRPYLPDAIVGRTSRNLDASDAIWQFFQGFRNFGSGWRQAAGRTTP